jgi:hypothetical protein
MNIIPFEPHHLSQIHLQDQQRRTISHLMTEPEYLQVLTQGPAISAVIDDRVLGCAGVIVQFIGIGFLWAAIAQDAGAHFIRMHRAARRLLEIPRLRRIEATSEVDFAQGCRWLELLSFECEGRMKKYGPDGADHYRYAWTGPRRFD